jgi:hypothetical protein
MPKVEKKSWTWRYFVKDGDVCKCTKCPYTHKPKQGTTSAMANHLRVIHKISPEVDSESGDVGGGQDAVAGGSGGTFRSSKEDADKPKVGY